MQPERLTSLAAESLPGADDAWKGPGTPDCWTGLSTDVIERFVEVTSCIHGPARSALRGYRADLSALDGWLRSTMGHTLVTASTGELWTYFRRQIELGVEPRLLDRLLASLSDFYTYLRECGCREDDPAARLPAWGHGVRLPWLHAHEASGAGRGHGGYA